MPANQPGYHGVKLKTLPVVLRYAGIARCDPVSPPVMSDGETSRLGCSDQIVTKMTGHHDRRVEDAATESRTRSQSTHQCPARWRDHRDERDGVERRVSQVARHQALRAMDEQREHDAERRESGELHGFAVRRGEEDARSRRRRRDRGRALVRPVAPSAIARKMTPRKSHSSKIGASERRHERDHDETGAVRRFEEVIHRVAEALEVKGRVRQIDGELAARRRGPRTPRRSVAAATGRRAPQAACRGARK